MSGSLPRNLNRELEAVSEHWFPRVVARVNDHYLKVAKVQGQLTWHAHEGQDELFLVLEGRLRIQVQDPGAQPAGEPEPGADQAARSAGAGAPGTPGAGSSTVREVVLEKGDVWVVPAGARHNPVADEECWIALVEPVDTDHTGGEPSALHRTIEDQLGG